MLKWLCLSVTDKPHLAGSRASVIDYVKWTCWASLQWAADKNTVDKCNSTLRWTVCCTEIWQDKIKYLNFLHNYPDLYATIWFCVCMYVCVLPLYMDTCYHRPVNSWGDSTRMWNVFLGVLTLGGSRSPVSVERHGLWVCVKISLTKTRQHVILPEINWCLFSWIHTAEWWYKGWK